MRISHLSNSPGDERPDFGLAEIKPRHRGASGGESFVLLAAFRS